MSTHRTTKHVNHAYDNPTGSTTYDLDDRTVRRLASSIIEQAVADWVYLIHLEEKWKKKENIESAKKYSFQRSGASNFTEIRAFFNSDWGDTLCDVVQMNAGTILSVLEGWLSEYHSTGKVPKYIFRVPDVE